MSPRRQLAGACLGNAVEWYDFAIYGAFSTILARIFFPIGAGAALAATFAIFATSFIARPVGAAVVGRRSDRLGRRPALSRVIVLMTVATAAIGLLPTWAAIGVLASIVSASSLLPILVAGPLADRTSGVFVIALTACGVLAVAAWSALLFGPRR